MIVSRKDVGANVELQADICIIGGGAAGITLACELNGSGLDVLLLDGGGAGSSAISTPVSDAYFGTAEHPHPPPSEYRRLAFGGTTRVWGGRCVPFDPIDFERRAQLPDSGWPIAYQEVARHYPKALEYCDAGIADFNADSALPDKRSIIPGMAHADLDVNRIERYSLPTDFGKRYGQRLAQSGNVRVLRQAYVIRLCKAKHSDRIVAVEYIGSGERPARVTASTFVLATGGIEVTRLLLASDDRSGLGFGNRFDHLGRYYMCHIAGVAGVVRPRRPGTVFHFEQTLDGIYAKRKIQFSGKALRRTGLLNIAFRLHYPNISDPVHRSAVLSAMYVVKQGLAPEIRRILQHGRGVRPTVRSISSHLRNIAFGAPQLAAFAHDWIQRRVLVTRKLPYVLVPNADGSFPLDFNSDQVPLRDSRLTLGHERDAFGIPRINVRWAKCEQDVDSICNAFELLRNGMEASGACRLEFELGALREFAQSAGPAGGHHIGTARMASSDRQGVVDTNCALFDFPNLYVASSAVFPTSSHANPTLTIVALAIRMAEHFKAIRRR